MSTIIIITPPPPPPPKDGPPQPDGFAQSRTVCQPYHEAREALEKAMVAGCTVRLVEV
jgi:hypothetical protein